MEQGMSFMSSSHLSCLLKPALACSNLNLAPPSALSGSWVPPSFTTLAHRRSLEFQKLQKSFGASSIITNPSDLFHKTKRSSASEPANAFHACCFDQESPFVCTSSMSCKDNAGVTALPAGCVAPPTTTVSPSHAMDVLMPRLATAGHLLMYPPPYPPPDFTNDYPANQVIEDLLSIIAHFNANRVSRARHTSDVIAAYRGLLRAIDSRDAALGPPPATTKQLILSLCHLTDLHYLFADALCESHAELNTETGFGQEHEPLGGRNDARVAEAEDHLLKALKFHNLAATLVDSVGSGVGRQHRMSETSDCSPIPPDPVMGLWEGQTLPLLPPVHTRSSTSSHRGGPGDSNACGDVEGIIAAAVRNADALDALCGQSGMRPTNAVPTSLILTKYALVVAARGKRKHAVHVLERVAEMDPWKPEFELRPPQVASSHRGSVENAKLGLVHYYNQCHDQRKADYYRDLVLSWRVRNIAAVCCFVKRSNAGNVSCCRTRTLFEMRQCRHTWHIFPVSL
jgi:hypothetical protein